MNDISFTVSLITKYLNRYFRREERLEDWSYEFNHDELIICIDYKGNYHHHQKISFHEISYIPRKDIERFSRCIAKSFIDGYTNEKILGDISD